MHQLNRQHTNPPTMTRGSLLGLALGFGLILTARAHLLSVAEPAAGIDRFQAMPLLFEAAGEGRFTSRAPGFGLQVAPGVARMALWPAPSGALGESDGLAGGVLVFRWQETAQAPQAEPEGVAPTRLNYFIGRDPSGWRTNVTAYQQVRYREVYPGIDVVYYGNDRQLEYDLWVSPGSDPAVARFSVEGADSVEISTEGDLVLGVGGGQVLQRRPVAFQWDGLRRELVEAAYVIEPGAPPTVGFALGDYDPERLLVIDPVVLHAAYYGGSGYDVCRRLLVTSSGALVVAGETTSTNLPVYRPLFDTTTTFVTNTLPGGIVYVTEVTVTNVNGAVSGGGPGATEGNTLGNEAFLAGFSADGRVLEFATYLGGGAIDAALDLAEDTEGNLLVYGLTQSADFPVVTHAAWSGMATTTVETVEELDGTNQVTTVQVTTNAWPIPTGWTPVWQTGISGTPFWGFYPLDAFFSVLSATGDRLLFSAYQGGADSDQGMRVAVGDQGRLYFISVQGATSQSLGRPIVVCVQSNELVYASSPLDGFALSALPLAAVATSEGGLWVAGQAQARSNQEVQNWLANYGCLVPLSASNSRPFQCTLGGGRTDAFLMRLDPAGQADYFTVLGGQGDDVAMGLVAAADGGVTVAGHTSSTNFPVYAALKTGNPTGLQDGFVTRLDATLTNLVFSTYLGQDPWRDSIQAMRLGPDGTLLLGGWTDSPYSPFDAAAMAAYWSAVAAGAPAPPGLGGLNGLVAGLAADGSRVLYGGILGGDGNDQVLDIGVGRDGTVWIAGQTHGFGTNYGDLVSTNWWREPDPAIRQSAVWQQPAGFVAQLYPGAAELTMGRSTEGLPLVSWPALWPGYELQASGVVGDTNRWTNVVGTMIEGTNRFYRVTDPAPEEFFRLQRP